MPASTPPRILVLNAGSSSLKGALIEPPEWTLARGETGWGADATQAADRSSGVAELIKRLVAEAGAEVPIDAVGHRVVHGGSRFTRPTRIDRTVLQAVREVLDLAPLHNGVALDAIEAARWALPDVPHVACFDTAFHATLPEAAWRYPVPDGWLHAWGVRRYGFHGLSVAWALQRAAGLLGREPTDLGLVVAHLGSGCSVTAVHGGRSVDTSMGWTPLEGLMMGTRAGSVDPGILVRLLAEDKLTVPALAEVLDHGAGLLAVAGTADMRVVVDRRQAGDVQATLAFEMFVRRVGAGIGAAATCLPGLDAIVFTGGIGEHSMAVRAAVVERLSVLGVEPSLREVASGDAILSARGAGVAVLCVSAREDLVIARETADLLAG